MKRTLASMTQGHLEERVAATTQVDPPQPPEGDDYCTWCGLERGHESEMCNPADVRDHVREMRWEERMREAGL